MQWHYSCAKRVQHTSLPDYASSWYSQQESNDQKNQKFKTDFITAESLHKNENEAVIKIKFQVAHLLSKHGKLVSKGELIKSCLIVAAEEVCPENVNLFQIISLSARIVVWRVKDTEDNINSQLKNETRDFGWSPLRSSWVGRRSEVAQLFIQGVSAVFEVTKESACMNGPMK